MTGLVKVSKKGQVTIPKKIRDLMGVGHDDMIEFTYMEDGKVLITKSNKTASSLFGILADKRRRRKGPVSIEEMDEAIAKRRRESLD